MAGTNYDINPVKATCIKYSGKDHGIQGLNDTCFGICAAFSGTFDTFAMDPICSQSCTDFIEQRKYELFGVGSCDHQVPYRPVAWQQIPRFIPRLLQQGMKVEQARSNCKNMCNSSVPLLAAECRETCDLDANAVEEYKVVAQQPPSPRKPPIRRTTLKQKEKNHPLLFWTIITVIVFIVSLAGIAVYRKIIT